MFLSNWANRISRFKLIAHSNDVPDSGDQGTLTSQAQVWDKVKALCGQTYTSDITYEWASAASVNVRASIDPALSDFGVFEENACGGLDCIRLNPTRATTTFAHEIGHALGFLHSITPIDLMCNEGCPNYETRDVQGWHIAKLLNAYAQYF